MLLNIKVMFFDINIGHAFVVIYKIGGKDSIFFHYLVITQKTIV